MRGASTGVFDSPDGRCESNSRCAATSLVLQRQAAPVGRAIFFLKDCRRAGFSATRGILGTMPPFPRALWSAERRFVACAVRPASLGHVEPDGGQMACV